MNVVLTKTDQKFIQEHGKQIMAEMKEYRTMTGKCWHPFNYDLGYANAEEWYNSLHETINSLKK